MNQLWTAFYMCLGMFTAIPLPQGKWDNELRKYSTACLPLVGLVVGIIWWIVAALAKWLLPAYLAGAAMAALPFVITGFMHLDGFMDASDALLSWRDRETRLKILKDVHVGSFAVVMLVLLAMFQFAACMSVEKISALIFLPMLSRAGSAYSVLGIQPLNHSEYAGNDEKPAALLRDIKVMAVAAMVLMLLFAGWKGLISGAVVLGSYALAMRACIRNLGGVSGDLAGFALTVSELCGLIALAIIG